MQCPKCGKENVNITLEQTEAKTRKTNMGCLWTMGRWCLIIFTCGLWLLFGKRKGTGKTKFKNKTVALCQSCGNKWTV